MAQARRLLWITTFGLGHMRPASGTWGSLPTVALAAALLAAGIRPDQSAWAYNGVLFAWLLVFSLGCVVQGGEAERVFQKKDPSQAVADETAGQAIPLMFLPAASVRDWAHAGATLLGAFLLFRVFDILKPWPANQLQALPKGWGILADDLAAGVQALLVVQLLTRTLMG